MSERADLGLYDAGLGRVSQGERRMLRVGSWATLPDANEREADGTFRWVGYFARTDSGTFVCERDGTGALWKLVASGAQGPQGPQGPEGPPGSGGSIQVESGDSGVFTAATVDFDSGDFVVTQSPAGEANVSLASAPAFSSFANAQHDHEDAAGGGTLTSAAISDFAETARDVLGTALVAGSNVTITVNDGADTITIAASGGGGGGDSSLVDLLMLGGM